MSELIMIRLILSVVRQGVNLLTHWIGKIVTIGFVLVVLFLMLKHEGIDVFKIFQFFIERFKH